MNSYKAARTALCLVVSVGFGSIFALALLYQGSKKSLAETETGTFETRDDGYKYREPSSHIGVTEETFRASKSKVPESVRVFCLSKTRYPCTYLAYDYDHDGSFDSIELSIQSDAANPLVTLTHVLDSGEREAYFNLTIRSRTGDSVATGYSDYNCDGIFDRLSKKRSTSPDVANFINTGEAWHHAEKGAQEGQFMMLKDGQPITLTWRNGQWEKL